MARKAKNWTQCDLAVALGVNVKNVSRWELGSSSPSLLAAIQLAKALEVSIDFLAGLDTTSGSSSLELLLKQKLHTLSNEQLNALKTILECF